MQAGRARPCWRSLAPSRSSLGSALYAAHHLLSCLNRVSEKYPSLSVPCPVAHCMPRGLPSPPQQPTVRRCGTLLWVCMLTGCFRARPAGLCPRRRADRRVAGACAVVWRERSVHHLPPGQGVQAGQGAEVRSCEPTVHRARAWQAWLMSWWRWRGWLQDIQHSTVSWGRGPPSCPA